jgi:hypothetical protein
MEFEGSDIWKGNNFSWKDKEGKERDCDCDWDGMFFCDTMEFLCVLFFAFRLFWFFLFAF